MPKYYPPGVTERDISPLEGDPCPICDGEGQLSKSPCCEADIVESEGLYLCQKCAAELNKECKKCEGTGMIYE